jgi:hypothetical protein
VRSHTGTSLLRSHNEKEKAKEKLKNNMDIQPLPHLPTHRIGGMDDIII